MNCEDILENVVANLEKQAGVVDSVKTAGNYLKDKGIAAAGYAKNKAGMAGSYAKDTVKKNPGKAAAIAGGALAAGGAGYALSKKAERKNTPASIAAGTATGAAIGAAAHNLGQAKNRERNAKAIVSQLKGSRQYLTPISRSQLASAGRYARHGAKVSRNRAALLGAAALGLGATIPALQKKAGIKDLAKHLATAKSKAGAGTAQAQLLAGVAAAKGKQAIRNNPKKALAAAAVPGAAAGAAYGAHRAMKKEAAEEITVNGQKYRKGTIGSAAGKTALTLGGTGALLSGAITRNPRLAASIGVKRALEGAVLGGGYGAVRGAIRGQNGVRSASGKKWESLKAKASNNK